MKNDSPSVVEELEGVISAMAHLVAALIAELPEPSKSVLLDFVGGEEGPDEELPEPDASSPGDGPDDADDDEESLDLPPEFLRGSARFRNMVLSLAKHFENDCEPYLERRDRFKREHEGAAASSPQEG